MRELSTLYSAFGSTTTLESVALKAALALTILLLQKPSRASKTKHHITYLVRRLGLWLKGELIYDFQLLFNSRINPDEPQDPHPVVFESLDHNAIRSAALR